MPSPLDGRRLWIAGIGGAGMSAYALLAQRVGRRGRAAGIASRRRTSSSLEGIDVEISTSRPQPPDGWEAVRVDGASRSASRARRAPSCSPSSSRLRDSIVVAGAHGKTTTSAMIAFCLERLGPRPGLADRRRRSRSSAATPAPATGWLVVEGDESDRTIAALRPRIAVVTNVDLDHHTTFGSRAEVEELFDEWLANVAARSCAARSWRPYDGRARRCRASTTGGTPPAALAALELAGVEREEAAAVLAEFRGRGAAARAPRRGRTASRVYDDYAHHPAEIAATLEARARRRRSRCSSSSSRISTRARGISRASSAAALAARRRRRGDRRLSPRAKSRSTASAASSSSTRSPSAARDARRVDAAGRGRRCAISRGLAGRATVVADDRAPATSTDAAELLLETLA